ncbi:MAG: peptidoglycan DD-metalloendopeptidase family protein [Deltaproteobacteria bacterium]|nr:peptidoglycan DD-metalloendopeptidase family protein [Deltaproteobacteria bacterium]
MSVKKITGIIAILVIIAATALIVIRLFSVFIASPVGVKKGGIEKPSAIYDVEAFKSAVEKALARGDKTALRTMLKQTEGRTGQGGNDVRSIILRAWAALEGTFFLDRENSGSVLLSDSEDRLLAAPTDMAISGNRLYVIDSGTLYLGDTAEIRPGSERLACSVILAPTDKIEGYPIKEIVSLAVSDDGKALYVLDKSGDVYRGAVPEGEGLTAAALLFRWSLLPIKYDADRVPPPLSAGLFEAGNLLFLLDTARNQIWRHPAGKQAGFLPGVLPWKLSPGETDLTGAIDLCMDGATGRAFVLYRNGDIKAYVSGGKSASAGSGLAAAPVPSFPEGLRKAKIEPAAIFTKPGDAFLYVADAGNRRVVEIRKDKLSFFRQFILPLETGDICAAAVFEGALYVQAGARLVRYDLSGAFAGKPASARPIPAWAEAPCAQTDATVLAPNDPCVLEIMRGMAFMLPIKGPGSGKAYLPDRSAVYPGARRAYRYGVHEGLDLANKDIGAEVRVGTPAYAAADGVVIFADPQYRDITIKEAAAIMNEAKAMHNTPYRSYITLSGRMVILDHGRGIQTVYSHLSRLGPLVKTGAKLKKGDHVGDVGMSGTPSGARGSTWFAHLHFEIRFGPKDENKLGRYNLGQWLGFERTRRAFEHIFPDYGVRPAYLDCDEKGRIVGRSPAQAKPSGAKALSGQPGTKAAGRGTAKTARSR